MVDNLTSYHRLDNIEDVDEFYAAINRNHLTKQLSKERPYTYWTIELYDMKNGIRGGGGLGVLAADTRRVAEELNVPLTLITPFYPSESHQTFKCSDEMCTLHTKKSYEDFGFNFIDTVNIRCNNQITRLDVIEKRLGSTRLLCVTEPNFGELYSGVSCGDHRLYQEVALGFGGYQALKLVGEKPSIMQLNEVATFFAALARLDELASNGMDFYEAVVYTRKHTLYTNHTLVQAAEADFDFNQFERFVFPNLKSKAVKKWLKDKFENGKIRLSSVTIEIAELRSGVSKLHARVANYKDLAGNKVKFKAITNGIDLKNWILPEILSFYHKNKILNKFDYEAPNFTSNLDIIDAKTVRNLKQLGRKTLNEILKTRPDSEGKILQFSDSELIFDFKRRFVDYKRPWLPFSDLKRLREILEKNNAHYILTGRVHEGDDRMYGKLKEILSAIKTDPFLALHVHYLPDYDEDLAFALSVGSNVSINTPIVGLEACGTSWMKDIGNLCLLVSTHDGGVADCPADSYLNVSGETEQEEIENLYLKMEEAANAWKNDFDLEYWEKTQLKNYLPVISGARMIKDYLEFLF